MKLKPYFAALMVVGFVSSCSLPSDQQGIKDMYEGSGLYGDEVEDIQGYVWYDSESDGIRDLDEDHGLGEIEVRLISPTGESRTVYTDGEGYYIFNSVPVSNPYTITVVPPEGYFFSPQNVGDDYRDSDVDPIHGQYFWVKNPTDGSKYIDAGLSFNRSIWDPEEALNLGEPPEALEWEPSPETINPYVFIGYLDAVYRHFGAASEVIARLAAFHANPEPLGDAEITVTIIHPDGSTETRIAKTGDDGYAQLTFPIHVYGTYTLRVDDVQAVDESIVYAPNLNIASSLELVVGPGKSPAFVGMDRVVAYYAGINAAFSEGDVEALLKSLHPAVIDLYGEQACRAYLKETISHPISVEVLSVGGFGDWVWERDERSTPIKDAYTVGVKVTAPDGASQEQISHVALRSDASIGWFTDCGDPLP